MFSAALKLPKNLAEEDVAILADGLDDLSESCAAIREDHKKDTPWVVRWFMSEKPEQQELTARITLLAHVHDIADVEIVANDWTIEPLADKNWLEESYKGFQPFSAGPFYIYGSHNENEAAADQISLQIDAATAFGSGEHGTTAGCLQAMTQLEEQGVCPWNVLDMGTGSGILAVAAWKLWKTMILAVDIDEESVIVAARHRDMNNVPADKTGMVCHAGDGFRTSNVQKTKPFDLIIANILAGPVIEMSDDLKAVCDDNAYIILSGMLNEQAEDVLSVYEAIDFELIKRIDLDGWTTLTLRKLSL